MALSAVPLFSGLHAQLPQPLRQIATVQLPGVTGRIDHLGFDAARQRLSVAALGNNSVEVVDTAKNAHQRSLSGFHEPQGIAVVSDMNAVAVANGDIGTLQLLDAQTFATRWTVSIAGDADNVRYDAAAKRLYVAAEEGLYSVDPASGTVVGRMAIDGHPEPFQLETAGTRVFANLPGSLTAQIMSADRQRMTAAPWAMPGCNANYPMALDEATSHLFVGCRRPARLALLSREAKLIASIDVVGDADDLFYDAARHRVYVIGGGGAVDVVKLEGEHLERVARVTTRAGARTGLWVPLLSRLYVAAPKRDEASAGLEVFEAN